MIRRALLLLALAAAAMPLAAGLELGPERTFAELRPGPPSGLAYFINAWAENGEVVTILDRRLQNHWSPTRMTIRADGTADPSALVALPIPPSVFNVAPFRGGMIAAWSGMYGGSVAMLDRGGKVIEGPKAIPAIDTGLQIVCNDTRCLLVNGRDSVLVDEHGQTVKELDRDRLLRTAVAGPRGFLLNTMNLYGEDPRLTLLDNDGTTREVRSGRFMSGVFDGERYVILTGNATPGGPISIGAVDPSTGTSSTPVVIFAKNTAQLKSGVTLIWNGSMYLITMQLAAGFRSLEPHYGYGPWFATMRVARSFARIDERPRPQVRSGAIAIGVPGGFRIIYGIDLRTAMLSASGPAVKTARPALLDRLWQHSQTAAASRSAILGVYSEYDAGHSRLVAARIARDGTRLDAVPLELTAHFPYRLVAAASDGDGFLVVWNEDTKLLGATIDAAGNVQTFTIDERPSGWTFVSIDFTGGAYQVAAVSDGAGDAITIAPTGAMVQRERFDFPEKFTFSYSEVSALFDGRRVLMLGDDRGQLSSITKDVPGGAVNTRALSFPLPVGYETSVLQRDGDGALALLTYYNNPPYAGDDRWIMRIGRDGDAAAPVLLSRGLFTSAAGIVRIDGVLHATFTDDVYTSKEGNQDYLVILPLDASTLKGGAERRFGSEAYRGHLVAGWNGEGLLFYDAAVPTASGITSQMAVRVVHAAPAN